MTTHTQRTKIGVAGSFINQLMANNSSTPKVGEGATILHYTDRTCAEVISVSEDGLQCEIEMLDAVADKPEGVENLPIGHQNWKFIPTGRKQTLRWIRNAWRIIGSEIVYDKAIIAEAHKAGFTAIGAYLYKYKPEIHEQVYNEKSPRYPFPCAVIEGVTREKKTYQAISILFGQKDYYYDWSF